MAQPLRPGDKAPRSGIYNIQGPRGGKTGDQRTADKGKPLPPTPKPNETYTLAKPTHHRRER